MSRKLPLGEGETSRTACARGMSHGRRLVSFGKDSVKTSNAWDATGCTIERAMARFAGSRSRHRRYERKATHFPGFAGIATTLICYRRLAD